MTGTAHVATTLISGTPIDEGYLHKVGQFELLPRWRTLASSRAEAG